LVHDADCPIRSIAARGDCTGVPSKSERLTSLTSSRQKLDPKTNRRFTIISTYPRAFPGARILRPHRKHNHNNVNKCVTGLRAQFRVNVEP
jgi:hypothetical protein